jgi:hypothetical protein
VEQEEIMLATETFIGKLSRGARPGQSVQLTSGSGGKAEAAPHQPRAREKLFVFFQVVSSRR